LKLGDFGSTVYTHQTKNVTKYSGTGNYVPPEFYVTGSYTKMVDWWALGVMIFEMIYGRVPFSAKGREELERSIKYDSVVIPSTPSVSKECKDFISILLKKIPEKRIGFESEDELLAHPWFGKVGELEPMDEDSLLTRKIQPSVIIEPNEGL